VNGDIVCRRTRFAFEDDARPGVYTVPGQICAYRWRQTPDPLEDKSTVQGKSMKRENITDDGMQDWFNRHRKVL
jgi:hypothetical protein